MKRERDPWLGAAALPGLAIDHIGIVVADCMPVVALLRGHGFQVSDPEPLIGPEGPLGQASAHCVFANGYVEISAPDPNSDNHLLPLLAQGEGIRILVLRSADAAGDHARLEAGGLTAGPVRAASRIVRLPEGEAIARFQWFPVADRLPGVLIAMAEHRDAALVFASALRAHPNGANRLHDVLLAPAAAALGPLATAAGNAAQALIGHGPTAPIHGLSATGIPGLTLDHTAFALRGIA